MKATLEIKDEVNVKIHGLSRETRIALVKKFKFILPYARHTPAFKLGRWDGTVAFFQMGGSTYINLLPEILPIIIDQGYDVELNDTRDYRIDYAFQHVDANTFDYMTWPVGHPHEDKPIVLRDHQVETINGFYDDTQSIQEVATGAGKTIITAILSMMCQDYGRTIIVVPNRSLVTQTEEDYINIGLDVGVIFGGRKEYGHQHTICTWQSLDNMVKAEKKAKDPDKMTMSEFMDNGDEIVAIIVDEAHGAKAEVLKQMMQGPFAKVPIRWGLTGTVPKEVFDRNALVCSIGHVTNEVTAKSLQDKGILANCHVNILQYLDWVLYNSYPAEMKFLSGDIARLEQISRQIISINESGNTLLLVNHIKTGKLLEEMIPNSVFLSGATKNDARKLEYDKIKEVDNRVIIATYGIAAVGINIPRIFNLCLHEPGKSFIKVIQSIGRGLRVASDKDHVEIWDFTSNCKFAKRHLTQRKKFYRDAQYPFTITKVERD